MANSVDIWPTQYNPGNPKHLHAIGVISMNFNAFERNIYSLYSLYLDRQKVPLQLSDFNYFSLSERLRLEATRQVINAYEKAEKVREVAHSVISHFDWSSHIRNSVLHARRHPQFLGREDDDAIQLAKRRNKNSSESGYLHFKLSKLREYADEIQNGNMGCVRLYIHVRQRGIPVHQWSSNLRAHGHEPLPEILETPEYLTLADHPFGPAQPRPRQSSSG